MDPVIIFLIENENFYNSQFLNRCFERRILKLESLVLTYDLLPVLAAEKALWETFVLSWWGVYPLTRIDVLKF